MLIIVSFVILLVSIFAGMVFFLRKIFNQNITSATSHLERMASEYAKKEEEIKSQYEEATRKSQEIVVNAQKELQSQKEQILKEAQDEKKKILDNAQGKADEMLKQADGACQALLKEINLRIEEKALTTAAELLKTVLPEGIRQVMHKKWLDDLIANGLTQLDRLKISESVSEATVVTPFDLSDTERDFLRSAMCNKLGRKITLVEKIDASIIAGLVVSVGNLVFDGSLRFKIQEAARGQQSAI